MSEILQANIFFYITSAAVVLVTVLVIVVLLYTISILRTVKKISDTLREGSDAVKRDLGELRHNLRAECGKARAIANFFLGRFAPKAARRSRKRASKAKSKKEAV